MAVTLIRNDLDEILDRLPPDVDIAVVRDGADWVVATEPADVIRADGFDALDVLDRLRDGWWAGFLAYDLGRSIERVPDLNAPDISVPDLLLVRFDNHVVVPGDAVAGDPVDLPRLGPWSSSLDRGAWKDAVTRIHEHLVAGDCYQVNLTRRLSADGAADSLALFRALHAGNPAPHAALVRIGDIAVVSASPERFLRRDGRTVETRPRVRDG